jgi:hypothetical protein
LDKAPEALKQQGCELLATVERLLTQQRHDKNKLYSLHAPEVECISKGKARQPYKPRWPVKFPHLWPPQIPPPPDRIAVL